MFMKSHFASFVVSLVFTALAGGFDVELTNLKPLGICSVMINPVMLPVVEQFS